MTSYKGHYSRFLKGLDGRLHFAAHSHHPWPDCTREAALACWDDASRRADEKWAKILGEVVPAAQRPIAEALRWPDPALIAFAPNTHEFVARLLSCLPEGRALRVLTTDSEFHSFARQIARLEEDGARVERVFVEPFGTFPDRFLAAAKAGGHDLIFFSHVFFNSGFRIEDAFIAEVAAKAPREALVVVDGYHAFMAVPVDLSKSSRRAFYLAGGYKYAQAGEGACFLAVPPDCPLRPANTGWFADFAGLERPIAAPVGYGPGGFRFWGSTFDPTALYRWNAVSAWRRALKLSVRDSDAHARALQRGFVTRLAAKARGPLAADALVSLELARIGHFLTLRHADAPKIARFLDEELRVIVDARGDRLRFGFGLYQDEADLDELFRRLDTVRG
jgi:selenocysteine lyase/cysteine desulfurase